MVWSVDWLIIQNFEYFSTYLEHLLNNLDVGYNLDILHVNVLAPIRSVVANDPGDMVCHIEGMATLISKGNVNRAGDIRKYCGSG